MIQKVRGVVLHHIKYRESSAILHVYTDLYGRQAYLVNNIKGKRARFSSNLMQPMTLMELEVYHREGRELQHMKEMRNHIPYRSIPYDPYKSSQVIFLAEVMYRATREEDPAPGLYDFIEHSLQLLDISPDNTLNFHLYFLVQLTKYLGFYPEDDFSAEKNLFDMRDGQFTDPGITHPDFFNADCSLLLHELIGSSFNCFAELTIKQDVRIRFLNVMMDYFRLQLQGFGEVRSLSVLHELFRE